MSDTYFIIKLQVAKKGSPAKQDEFVRNEQYDAHIYRNEVFPISELNEVYPKVLAQYWDFEMPAPEPLPPIPQIVKKIYPNMEKARAALAAKQEAEKGKPEPESKRIIPKLKKRATGRGKR